MPLAPDRLETGIAATAVAVEAVLRGILLVVVLVIFLRRIERADVADGDDDGPVLEPLLNACLRRFRGGALLVVEHENLGTILRPDVTELAVRGEGIDIPPVVIEQLVV